MRNPYQQAFGKVNARVAVDLEVVEFYLDVVQKQLIKRNLVLFSVRQDTALHCSCNQLGGRHFVQHEERNISDASLSNSHGIKMINIRTTTQNAVHQA